MVVEAALPADVVGQALRRPARMLGLLAVFPATTLRHHLAAPSMASAAMLVLLEAAETLMVTEVLMALEAVAPALLRLTQAIDEVLCNVVF